MGRGALRVGRGDMAGGGGGGRTEVEFEAIRRDVFRLCSLASCIGNYLPLFISLLCSSPNTYPQIASLLHNMPLQTAP